MAEAHLQQFLEKVCQLNAFVALSERDPALRQALIACSHHDEVVALARRRGFEIGRRWGEPLPGTAPPPEDPAPGLGGWDGSDGRGCLLEGPCPPAGEEWTQVLLLTPCLRLERIHSNGAVSPQGFWYDQAEMEWVLLLQGSARLRFADEEQERQLHCGDSLLISSGRRHRVTASDPAPGTVWLALFWSNP